MQSLHFALLFSQDKITVYDR